MNEQIKSILEKCNESYSKGEVYFLKDDEYPIVEKEFNITIPHLDVDDSLYDIIYYCAKEKWPEDSFFNKLTSNNIGYGQDIIHEIPMGSMEELKEGNLEKWTKGHEQFLISDKLDGCSLILTYENGELTIAATRGHGTKGKDIMRHVQNVGFPKKISYKDKIIIRGELLFPKICIPTILNLLEQASGKKQKNGRNTIAGALNSKETRPYIFQQTDFVAYWTSKDQGTLKAFEFLKKEGFKVPFYQVMSADTLTDDNMIDLVKTRLKFSDYELDGIIITQLDNIEDGFVGGTINPKCSRKFKLGIHDNIAESIVTNINWQISRWGVFTPVLEIEPVEVAGAKITNITAHNYENVVKSKCGIGAKIKFKRAGLVIPKLEEVLIPSENYNLPKCKAEIQGVDLVYIWSDDTPEYAREMGIRRLEYFGEKLGIDQLGYGNCAKIYDEYINDNKLSLYNHPYRIYTLPEGEITRLIGENGKKIEASLKAKKSTFTETQFAAACGSFGPDIGERVLNLVWNAYGTLEYMTEEKLQSLEGFGKSRIEQYLEYEHLWYMTKIDMELNSYNIIFVNPKNQIESTICSSYNVCFSGVRDKTLENYINKNGGQASDKWNKNVNCLVVKDLYATSSKIEKARKANVRICTLEDLKKELNYE